MAEFDPNKYVEGLNYSTLRDIVLYGANLASADDRRAATAAAQRRMNQLSPPQQPTSSGMGMLGTQEGTSPTFGFDPGVSVGTMNLDPNRGMITRPAPAQEESLSLGAPPQAVTRNVSRVGDGGQPPSAEATPAPNPLEGLISGRNRYAENNILEQWEQGGFGGDLSQFQGSADVLGLDLDQYGTVRSGFDELNWNLEQGNITEDEYVDLAWNFIEQQGINPVQEGTDKLRWLDPGSGVDIYTPRGYDVNLAGNWGEEGSALMRRDARTEGEGPIGQFNEAKTLGPLLASIIAPQIAPALGITGGLGTGLFTGATTAGTSALAGNDPTQALVQGLAAGVTAGTIPRGDWGTILDPNVINNLTEAQKQAVFSALENEMTRQGVSQIAGFGLDELAKELGPEVEWQPADVSDVLGDVQVQVPDYEMPTEEEGGGGGAGSGGEDGGSSGGQPSVDIDPERPWLYQGDGVFVNVLTGDSMTQENSDNYTEGEYYSSGQEETLMEEDPSIGVLVPGYTSDVFSTDPFGDTTADGTIDGGGVDTGGIGDGGSGTSGSGNDSGGSSSGGELVVGPSLPDAGDGGGTGGTGEGDGGDGEGSGTQQPMPTSTASGSQLDFDPFQSGISYNVPMLTRTNIQLRNFLAELYARG